jgi:general secretion pathway protein F
MATFFYKAVGKAGNLVDGVLEGADDRMVALKLQEMGLIPIQVGKGQAGRTFRVNWRWGLHKVRSKEVMLFTQELSTLVNAGLPLDRSLVICKQLAGKPAVQSLIEDVLQGIKGGKSFADSLAAHPEAFSRLYVNMVRAGEVGGSLPAVLDRLVEFEQSADELRSYLVSSLIYPVLLACVGVASIAILLNFVIPKFAQVFQEAGQSLPLPTQILLNVSNFSKSYWWVFLLAGGGISFLFSRLLATERGRWWWDGFRLKLVLMGEVLRKVEVARISRTLGTLVHNSVPLIQSLNIVREISGNVRITKSLAEIAEGVKKGEGVAGPMERSGVFPPLAIHLIQVGEETGRLDTMLLELARVYDKEVRSAIKNLIALFEPLMIVVMGVIVGVIVVSMLLAITSINDVPL